MKENFFFLIFFSESPFLQTWSSYYHDNEVSKPFGKPLGMATCFPFFDVKKVSKKCMALQNRCCSKAMDTADMNFASINLALNTVTSGYKLDCFNQ